MKKTKIKGRRYLKSLAATPQVQQQQAAARSSKPQHALLQPRSQHQREKGKRILPSFLQNAFQGWLGPQKVLKCGRKSPAS